MSTPGDSTDDLALIAPLLAARPRWTAIETATHALGLRRYELLHAGPPLRDARQPPPVLRSSIVMTCLHEGWATSAAEAEELLHDGVLQLSPAQDHHCVTPLAAVVSGNTPLFAVHDAAGSSMPMHAPVATVRGPDTRMGARDTGLLARLQHRDAVLVPALRKLLAAHGPLALWPVIATGLAHGDDLHSRTAAANQVLVQLLQTGSGDSPTVLDDVAANPLFFLTLLMAASALVLRTSEGGGVRSLVTRAGGNGETFAIALAGRPTHWTGCDAAAPDGPRLPGAPVDVGVSGGIGDSAVIDMLGFGGQRLRHAPEPLSVFRPYLPADVELAVEALLAAPHPELPGRWPVGVDACRVMAWQQAPLVALAMLADDGVHGFLGRGVYCPPVALFARAVQALD